MNFCRFLFILFPVGICFGFGPVGHETIAYIAEDQLSPGAKEKIKLVLGSDSSLADVSTWADQVRPSRPYTDHWHFIDLEVRQNLKKADEPSFCLKGNCVVDQIEKDVATLKDSAQPPNKKLEALKFLIHFVGDIHQPLHCADDSDRGGNEKIIRYIKPGDSTTNGRKIKFHALWDDLIDVDITEDPRILANTLEKSITEKERKKWANDKVSDWAWESYSISKTKIFIEFSPGPTDLKGIPLPSDYYSGKMKRIVNQQIEKAGIRLAFLLEEIFGK